MRGQCEYGYRLDMGKGVQEDKAKANEYYLLSAKQGFTEQCII